MRFVEADFLFDGENWLRDVRLEIDETGRIVQSVKAISDTPRHSVVIPGFVNSHSHCFQRAMAGFAEKSFDGKDSFWGWRERMYGLVNSLSAEDFAKICRFFMAENLQCGYTTLVEFHYFHNRADGSAYEPEELLSLNLIHSAKTAGIRFTLLPVLYMMGGFGRTALLEQKPFLMESVKDYLRLFSRLSEKNSPSFLCGMAIHSLRAVTKSALQELVEKRGDLPVPIHIHIAEQELEVTQCQNFYGKRPVEWILDNLPVDERWSLIHATHVSAWELLHMARKNVVAGLCPITEANLGDGLFPLRKWLDLDGSISIGSDSNIRLDPFEELRLLEYGQRLTKKSRCVVADPNCPSTGMRLVRSLYKGSSQSSGFSVGGLKVGDMADFLVLDPSHPSLINPSIDTLWDRLIFSGSREMILNVFVGGEQVVHQGIHSDYKEALKGFSEVLLER
ncbi:MAG: formimidoylglutamate deiminase [Candidatus Cloacimonetes bacterium]|nr:formimidoylglutamate deiminase [Candidatus Cloacimonadota bacterium]